MEKNTIYSNNIDCNLYKWNLDKNGFPLFTEKNLKFTVALVENDSKYRISFDATHPKSSAYLLSQGFPTEETIRDVVKLLDKENATHLSVSGVKTGKTNNQGIEIFVEKLLDMGLKAIKERIATGDTQLVDELASLVPQRHNISCASKFCTFLNRYCYGKDDYSIFDSVLCNILAYYSYVYLGERNWKEITGKNPRKESNIREKVLDKTQRFHYREYHKLISDIIEINKKDGITISRRDFDWMLWYYFKGDTQRIIDANQCLGKPECIISHLK